MKIVYSDYIVLSYINRNDILTDIERAARTCYKSEGKISTDSAAKLVRNLVKNGHHAMLEFADITVKFIVDRGVSHELVRHRLCDFAQESTRFCNYGNSADGVSFIWPCYITPDTGLAYQWIAAMEKAEYAYMEMLDSGCTPQEARCVLPNSVKTEVVMKANLREWRNIFELRACGKTGTPHPQMLEVMVPLLIDLKYRLPEIFDDLKIPDEYVKKYVRFDI